ncbi:MAG: LacI family DNA-binding transcriptional regulator [Planctomycetota bacterium]
MAIERVADELGYRPNGAARAMSSGKTGLIDLLMSTSGGFSRITGSLLEGVHDALADADMHLSMSRLPDGQLVNEGFMPKILREYLCDGLLVNYTHHAPPQMKKLITRYRIPVVWLNVKQPVDAVYPDDEDGSRRATEYLLSLGHRRIAYLAYRHTGHYSETDRARGYSSAMEEAGLEPHAAILDPAPFETVCDKPGQENRLPLVRQWLSQPDRPTAVVTYGSEAAAVITAAAGLGLSVPGDLSVMSTAHAGLDPLGIGLTHMRQPGLAMGQQGVRMLLQKIASPAEQLPSRSLVYELAIGNTTQPSG